ncbi:dual oxidase maturation factor 1-like [Centruroides sculpturatus]|uniref:dual oxidase maturation factor 1-like n=1 Tax=Centruroides sculpturatus TaxID=218467 RepID=UPI000C6E1284|nr:dual oxidase maturation factor 1-like [Centruroides sculpturatus]
MGFKEKIIFISGCWSCLIGFIILGILLGGQNWQETYGTVVTQYGVMPPRSIDANLTIYIGLQDVTIITKGFLDGEKTEIESKEFFSWRNAYMKDYLRNGLQKGLPYPVLSILEYLNEDHGWGARLCLIGRLVSAGLWISLAIGLLSAIFVQVQEKWLMGTSLALTGFTIISSCLIYYFNLLKTPVVIYISGKPMPLIRGWMFYFTLNLGIVCVILSTSTLLVLSLNTLETPIQFICKIYFKVSMLFRKHVPHLQAIT